MKRPVFLAVFLFLNAGTVQAQSISPLKAGDFVMLEIAKPESEAPNISALYTLDRNGEIRLPRLETPILAAGLSMKELARHVESAYRSAGIFKEPVIVASRRTCGSGVDTPPLVTVGGEVKSGGREVPWRDGMRLYQALMTAGGLTEFADIQRVKVFSGKSQATYDLRKVAPDGSNNPVLKNGDAIHVPQEGDDPAATPMAPAEVAAETRPALLKTGDPVKLELQSPAEDSPNVSARYTIAAEGTLRLPYLKESLPVAGLELKDLEQKIAKAYRESNVYKAPEFKASLPPADAKAVPNVSVGGEVKQPGRVIAIGEKGLRLYQAIMAAGGLTEFADMRKVGLFRDGKEISYDLRIMPDNGSNNPALQDGDTVFIPRD